MKWCGPFLVGAVVGTALFQIPSRAVAQTPATSTTASATSTERRTSPFEQATMGMKRVDGLWTLYHKDQRLFVDFSPSHLNRDFIILTSIARGISKMPVLGGMSWGFGDDVIWTFRKVGDKLHVVRRNIRFRANPGSPEGNAVEISYSDSVLYALPIITQSPSGGMLVDLTRIFMSDDQQIGRFIGPSFSFAYDRSNWEKVKSFPKNVELEVAAVYGGHSGGSGGDDLDTYMDARGVSVNVHYSISLLPTSGYRPRQADDRVGYFLTVIKDFSDKTDDDHFVRYINRWNLQKADPSVKLSPPKEAIRFYLEKTIPIGLRPIVRSGIEEWNKAFEKLGYANAIEVLQQPDDADWDPEDIRYNTFRWITANAGFAMGPSRVNPLTGQILDADIIFDADFMTHWKQEYESFTLKEAAEMTGESTDPDKLAVGSLFGRHPKLSQPHCAFSHGMSHQMGLAASIFAARGDISAVGRQVPEEFIRQGLKEVVMHEVGHTLGLRHNFKASAWKTLAEMDDTVKGAAEGTVASVMDYTPANIVPKGKKQGLYFTPTIGPYDYWAIEYGYKSMSDESAELKKLASRAAEPALDFGTDEDTRGVIDSDPLANRFDLSKDPLEYSRRQMDLAKELLPLVVDKAVEKGESYTRARLAFNFLFREFWRTNLFTARYPGGLYVARDHKGDPNGRVPFRLVDPAQQRAAMDQLSANAFNPPPLPTDVLNYLASTHWNHWGIRLPERMDYPVTENVTLMQRLILRQLLSPYTLKRLHDNEVKTPDDKDAYTLAEHFRKLLTGTFTEVREKPKAGKFTERKPFISTYRRNLQRVTLMALASLVTSSNAPVSAGIFSIPIVTVPEDARTLTRMYLTELDKQITTALTTNDLTLDDYSKAHLLDTQERIRKALGAQVVTPSIN